eukprot:7381929-Prymnesium_polylepis.2
MDAVGVHEERRRPPRGPVVQRHRQRSGRGGALELAHRVVRAVVAELCVAQERARSARALARPEVEEQGAVRVDLEPKVGGDAAEQRVVHRRLVVTILADAAESRRRRAYQLWQQPKQRAAAAEVRARVGEAGGVARRAARGVCGVHAVVAHACSSAATTGTRLRR